MTVTNIFVKPDEQPPMRISSQRGFSLNHRKKFQRPPTTKHKHVADVFDDDTEVEEQTDTTMNVPRGTTSKHQLQTYSRGDK